METQKWYTKSRDSTHLILDGGSIKETPGFLEAYITDLTHGHRLHIVEKKTNRFRFFVDVDFVSTEHELDFEKVAMAIYDIACLGPCLIARAKPREVSEGVKYGMHMIWPDTSVTKEKAQGIRMKLLREMGPDWDKVIDASVYQGSGLRMLWSFKNESGSTVYVPWGRIEFGRYTEFKDKTPSVEYLKMFSIRHTDETVEDVIENSQPHTDLEEFIRKTIPGHEGARVVRVKQCRNKKDFYVATDSKYCENIKRRHKSNHVWFCILPKSGVVFQKCQDENCKSFSGKRYRIPSRLIPRNERDVDSSFTRSISEYIPEGWKGAKGIF
jgi:hypothetical protein